MLSLPAYADTSLRQRLVKHGGNNHLRVDAWVVRMSGLSSEELKSKCGQKMCNERRAAERILAWRAANPDFQEHRTGKTQADYGKPRGKSDFSGRKHKAKRKHRPEPGHGSGSEGARGGHDSSLVSGHQQRAASVVPVVSTPSKPCRLGLAEMQAEHRRLCAMKGLRTRSFANAAAVPFPYREESSGTPLPSIGSGFDDRPKAAPSERAVMPLP